MLNRSSVNLLIIATLAFGYLSPLNVAAVPNGGLDVRSVRHQPRDDGSPSVPVPDPIVTGSTIIPDFTLTSGYFPGFTLSGSSSDDSSPTTTIFDGNTVVGPLPNTTITGNLPGFTFSFPPISSNSVSGTTATASTATASTSPAQITGSTISAAPRRYWLAPSALAVSVAAFSAVALF